MRTLLPSLLALSIVGPLVKADSLDYKYTWHIDGVVLPNGIQLPSIELAFLAGHDLFFGYSAIYNYNETGNNVVPLYLRESVSPSSPNYIDPFESFSGFGLLYGGDDDIIDEFFMGGNVAGYDTFGTISGVINGGSGPIYGFFNDERALTTQTLRLDMVPEPSAASLLAIGLVGIAGLALWRKWY
ncbi:MAG: PEP-CTERM sorting domain-containing protein, partial [Bryobacteraceae bacterium]